MVSNTDELEQQQAWEVDRAEESEEGDEGEEDDGDYEAGDEGEEEVCAKTRVGLRARPLLCWGDPRTNKQHMPWPCLVLLAAELFTTDTIGFTFIRARPAHARSSSLNSGLDRT